MVAYSRMNALDEFLDIAGSRTQSATKTLSDEPSGYGQNVPGQTGSAASIASFSSGISLITGLTGMTVASAGRFLTVSGASSSSNNGTFLIVQYIGATSVQISNASGIAPDANNGSIVWAERDPYTLEDDINFIRTERKNIKGTPNFYDAVPTYQRPTAVGTNVDASLFNLAGKTTDAKAITENRAFFGQIVAVSDTFTTITSVGNLKHATALDRTGVPIFDGADAANDEATYVEIVNPADEAALEVLTGPDAGKRIFGRTRAGVSISPDSVEIEFRAVAKGANILTSVAYTWETGQPTVINMYYGYRVRLDQLSDTALRITLASGIVGDADLEQDVKDIRQVIGVADDQTSLNGYLTNTGSNYVFSDLPDATPSVVEALNTLNEQIGDRTYTGPYLVSGQAVASSLQSLSDAISGSAIVRTIERLSADLPAGIAHTLPGGLNYTLDGTGNGKNMFVFWRGVLRDPGSVLTGNDYLETSSTSITPNTTIYDGDHINYLVLS